MSFMKTDIRWRKNPLSDCTKHQQGHLATHIMREWPLVINKLQIHQDSPGKAVLSIQNSLCDELYDQTRYWIQALTHTEPLGPSNHHTKPQGQVLCSQYTEGNMLMTCVMPNMLTKHTWCCMCHSNAHEAEAIGTNKLWSAKVNSHCQYYIQKMFEHEGLCYFMPGRRDSKLWNYLRINLIALVVQGVWRMHCTAVPDSITDASITGVQSVTFLFKCSLLTFFFFLWDTKHIIVINYWLVY